MKATKTLRSNGQPKGAWLYGIKKNGERYAKPSFYELVGAERNNPGSRFEIAENQEELNIRFA